MISKILFCLVAVVFLSATSMAVYADTLQALNSSHHGSVMLVARQVQKIKK